MPIYEYRCPCCGNEFEELVLSRTERVQCPDCGGTEVERILSPVCFSTDSGFRSSYGSESCRGCSGGTCRSCSH